MLLANNSIDGRHTSAFLAFDASPSRRRRYREGTVESGWGIKDGCPPDMQLLATETVLKQAEMIANELAG